MTQEQLENAQEDAMRNIMLKAAELVSLSNEAAQLFRFGLPDAPVPLSSTVAACKAYLGKMNQHFPPKLAEE